MNDKTQKLIETINAYAADMHDEVAPASAISYAMQAFWYRGSYIDVTETARKQLCQLNGIPYAFFNDVMKNDERTSIFNRINQERGTAEHLLRFHGNTLFGCVSPRYKRIDNIRILDVLEAATDSGIGLKPVRWTLSHDHTRVTLVPDRANVGELTPSITVVNSENGLASLSLWAGVYRWVCTNGLMVPVSDITKSRWMHIGNNDISLPDIRIVLSQSMEWTERLYDARSRYLSSEDKRDVVLRIADRLGQRAAEKVVEVANREYRGGQTLFDSVNAVTRAAQSFSPAQQTDTERFASTLLAA